MDRKYEVMIKMIVPAINEDAAHLTASDALRLGRHSYPYTILSVKDMRAGGHPHSSPNDPHGAFGAPGMMGG